MAEIRSVAQCLARGGFSTAVWVETEVGGLQIAPWIVSERTTNRPELVDASRSAVWGHARDEPRTARNARATPKYVLLAVADGRRHSLTACASSWIIAVYQAFGSFGGNEVHMGGDGRQLEALVASIERVMLPPGFEVKTNRRVHKDGVQLAEFDVG